MKNNSWLVAGTLLLIASVARPAQAALSEAPRLAAIYDLILDAQFDRELLAEARARIQARVEPHTWQAFRMTAVDGESGADVAGRLEMKVATVFKARSKVQKSLQEEVRKLEESWS